MDEDCVTTIALKVGREKFAVLICNISKDNTCALGNVSTRNGRANAGGRSGNEYCVHGFEVLGYGF